MMDMYGINNVRGGSFTQLTLDKTDYDTITKMLNGANDRCFLCGQKGHFIATCPDKNQQDIGMMSFINEILTTMFGYWLSQPSMHCERCGRNNHSSDKCYAKTTFNGKPLGGSYCKRCERQGHYETNCYAKTTKYGTPI